MLRAMTGTSVPIVRPVPVVVKPVAPIPAPRPVSPPPAVMVVPPPAVAPAVSPPPNPYPTGIKVAGTGPNGSATTWRTGWHTVLDVYVADTGFGIAPIYTDDDFQRIVGIQPGGIAILKGYPNEYFATQSGAGAIDLGPGIDINGNPLEGMVELFTDSGNTLIIKTKDGGTQFVSYVFDGTRYIPSSAQGMAKPSVPFIDQFIMWTAIAATTVITAGGQTGLLGPATPGPGPAALAGSPSDLAAGSYSVAASPAFTAPAPLIQSPPNPSDFSSGATSVNTPPQLPPEIANFTPTPVPPSAPLPPDLGGPLNVSAIGAGTGGAAGIGTGGEILSGIRTAGQIAGAVGTVAGTVAKLTSGSTTGAALPPARPIVAPAPVPSGHGLFSNLPPAQVGAGASNLMWPLLILAAVLLVAHGSD